MTALDVWMLSCVMHLVLSIFEYALLLGIRYGKQFKINTNKKGSRNDKTERMCLTIDRYALRVFVALQLLTVGTYFYNYYTVPKN